MKGSLLHSGVILAALVGTVFQTTAQDTPLIPPVNLNEASIQLVNTGDYSRYELKSNCLTWDNLNDDGSNSKWQASKESKYPSPVFKWQYHTNHDTTDDWLFLPDMQLETAQYDISFVYWKYSDNFTERLGITLAQGKNVTAHTGDGTIDVFYKDMPKGSGLCLTPAAETVRVTVSEAGVYNLALRSTSDRNTYYMYVGDLTVTKVDPAAPTLPVLTVTADGMDATVSVTFPTTDVSGNDIPAGIVMTAGISVNGTDKTASATGTPGSTASATVTLDKSGTYTATCSVSYSDAAGLHSSDMAFSDEFSVAKKKPAELPDGYTLMPDNDQKDWAVFVDANDDHNTFSYVPGSADRHWPLGLDKSDNKGVWCYEYSETMAADEWLITPVWSGSATGAVKLSFGVATYYDGYADYDVCLATSDNIETLGANVVFSETGLCTRHNPYSRETFITVEPDTQYYVAFHLRTPLEEQTTTSWYTDFFNIKCESVDGTIPVAATISEPVNDRTHAGVSFSITLPTKDVVGNDITYGVVYADLYMTGQDTPETLSGAPGTVIEKTYTDLEIGKFYDFRVHTYKLDGDEKKGDRMATTSVRIEIDDTYTFNAPVSFNFGSSDIFDICTVIDANEDNITFQNIPGDCAKIKWNSTMAMDDWLITKGINVSDTDELYDLVLTCRNSSPNYHERCELYWGSEPTVEAMTNLVFSEELVSSVTTEFRKPVRFDAPCTIFLGVHGCSDKDRMNLEVKNAGLVAHETGVNDPGEVTDIVADGKKSGEAVAEISFRMPVNTYGELVEVEPEEPGEEPVEGEGPVITTPVYERVGQPLKADLQLTAVVKTDIETKKVTGLPGQEISVEIAAKEGTSEITVFVQSPEYTYTPEDANPDTNGDGVVDENDDNVAVTVPMGQGPKSTVETFCGLHLPKAPVVSGQPVLTDDNLGFTIAWEAVTECANEGETHLNPEGLVYRVYESVRGAEEPQLVAETSELNATVRLADDADKTMAMHIYTVTAFNGLESEESDAFAAIFGQPESLPMEDNFADGYAKGMFLVWGMGDYIDPATAGAPATESNVALYLESDQDLYVELPKFSTDGVAEGYIEFTFHADATTAPVTVTMEANGDAEPTVLGTLEATADDNGWKSVYFNYPATLLNKKAVSVKCTTSIGTGQKFLLDSYIATNYAKAGLDNVSALAGASARGLEGAILLRGFAGHEVTVCTPDGRVTATVNAADDAVTVPAATGIYVVAADGFAAKVAVK